MANAPLDENTRQGLIAESSNGDGTIVRLYADPTTHRLLVDLAGGSGTVTSVSVVSANGFAGTVANATTTPAITLTTTITGILQGNGTAISAVTVGSGLSFAAGTLSAEAAGLTVGTSTITGGTDTRILYNNAGTLGEYAISGTGDVVMTNSPTLVTPALGTPSALVLTNATGLPLSTGVTGDLPFSNIEQVATNRIMGRATAGTGDIEALTASSARSVLGLSSSDSPQFTAIELGHATDTTISRSAAGVIAVEGVVIPSISSTNTLTNKRVTRRLTTTNAPGATPTTNTDNVDIMNFTGLATAITSMTTNLSGTPVDGDLIEFRFTDNGTARAITWGASFAATTVALPTTTVTSTMLRVLFEWGGSTWDCVAVA